MVVQVLCRCPVLILSFTIHNWLYSPIMVGIGLVAVFVSWPLSKLVKLVSIHFDLYLFQRWFCLIMTICCLGFRLKAICGLLVGVVRFIVLY